MSIQIDMQQVAGQSARQLGAEYGEKVLELVAQQIAYVKLSERVAELEGQLAERDAELGRLRAADELLQERIRELEEANAERESSELPLERDEG